MYIRSTAIAALALEDGRVFPGEPFGADRRRRRGGLHHHHDRVSGGRHRSLVPRPDRHAMTYPLIGNYGVTPDDDESRQPWARARRSRVRRRSQQLAAHRHHRRLPEAPRHPRHHRRRYPRPHAPHAHGGAPRAVLVPTGAAYRRGTGCPRPPGDAALRGRRRRRDLDPAESRRPATRTARTWSCSIAASSATSSARSNGAALKVTVVPWDTPYATDRGAQARRR